MFAVDSQLENKAVKSDDLELVHATRNGDVSAFEDLVKRYDRKLFRIAHRITNNREDSRDVVQETFIKVFQHLREFREDSRFSTWLMRITLNQALMKLRKRSTKKEVSLHEEFQGIEGPLPFDFADCGLNPEELCQVSELRDGLRKAVKRLRPLLRKVFVLRELEGRSTDETAEDLGISPSSVKARLRRARLQLRELLTKNFSESERTSLKFSLVASRASSNRLR